MLSLLGNAKISHCGFCFPTPVPQQHLRNLPGITTQRHRGRGPVCKPGNTSKGEKRLTNKMRINLYSSMCFSVYRSQSQWTHQDRCIRWQGWIESTQISALVTSDSENVLLTNGMPSSLLTTFRTGTNFCKIGCCLTFSLRGVTPMINDMALRRFPVGQNIC